MGVEHKTAEQSAIVVLPGTRKLKTVCLLTPAPDSLRVEAFVCRNPEENHAGVHEWLLQRNRRLFGIAYTVDAQGDIYLVGQLPPALSDEDLDRVLGQVLEASDGDFNKILERGFSTSIKREWEWRVDRGESLANLEQFRHLADES
ncbi:YbjN domain-containing protein [Corynebacterium freneyi]|nr:YbjN domain-containing protein [Corynebacterium freneyi]